MLKVGKQNIHRSLNLAFTILGKFAEIVGNELCSYSLCAIVPVAHLEQYHFLSYSSSNSKSATRLLSLID